MMNEQGDINFNCAECVVNNKKGFLFKKEKIKVFSCSCLKDDSKIICGKCKKMCHITEEHEAIELGEKCISEFICSCLESTIQEKRKNLSEVKIRCNLYELFKGDKSFFIKQSNQYSTIDGSTGKKPSPKYFCLFCDKSDGLTQENDNSEMEDGVVCSNLNEKNDIQSNFEKIFKFIKDIPSVESKGKKLHLIQIFQKLYNQPNFKVYFDIFEETVKNSSVIMKRDKNKIDEDVTTICKYVTRFIKFYYKNVLRNFIYPNDMKVSFLNFETVIEMLNISDFRMEMRVKCVKIFKYMIFNYYRKGKFIRLNRDKNCSALHRMMFSETLDELFEDISIINKEKYFKLMQIIIEKLNFSNNSLNEENFLLLFIQYLDLLNFVYNCRDLEWEIMFNGNMNISLIIEYIVKNENKFNSSKCIRRRDKIITRLEKITYLYMLKRNDHVVFKSLKNKMNSASNPDSSNIDEYAFQKNDKNDLIIKNLFSIIDSSEKCISKLDILDLSLAKNDFFQENLKIIYESNLKLDEKMLKINNADFREKYKSYDEKFNALFIEVRDHRINLVEDKCSDVINFYENMDKNIDIILANINEAFNNNDIQDSKEIKQIMLYKIGYLDLLVDILYFLSINRYMKDKLKKETKEKFYEKTLSVISLIVEGNSFLIRLMLTHYYVTKLFSIKKNKVQIDLLHFYEKHLKKLREDYFLSDVSFFCQHVGEIYKKEYLYYIKNHKNLKLKKKDFLEKSIMIISCFKVCMEVLTDNNLYVVSKKLYYIILFIIKEKDQEADQYDEEIDHNKLKIDTFFNENLHNLGREENISFDEKESFKSMNLIELELYYFKNIFDLLNLLNMEFFNLICTYIDMKPIKKLCSQTGIPPLIRKALFSLYVKYSLGNYFNISVLFPSNLKDLIDFDLVIKEIEKRIMRKIENQEFDKESDIIMNENYGLMVKIEESNEKEKEKEAIIQNLIRYNMEKDCYKLIITNMINFPLIFNDRSFSNKKIQKNIYNYFNNAIFDSVNMALFRLIMYPVITKEMKLTIFKIIIYFIKCFHHLMSIIKLFVNVIDQKLFKNYFTLDKLKKDFPNLNDDIMNYLDKAIERLDEIINKIDKEYIFNLDLSNMLTDFKWVAELCKKSYKEKSKTSENKFKNSLIEIVNNYNNEKKKEDNNVIFGIFKDINTNESTRKNLFISLFREINLRSGIGISKMDLTKHLNTVEDKKKTTTFTNKSSKTMKSIKFANYNKHKTSFDRNTFNKIDKESFIKPNKNIIIFNCINRLIKQDPHFCQVIIRDSVKNKDFFNVLIKEKFIYLFQMCINNFKVMDYSRKNINIDFLNELIEFFRLLCEHHNKHFQSFIINFNYEISGGPIPLISIIFNHLTKILLYIEYFANKESLLEFCVVSKKNYFKDVLTNLNNLLIECIQGSYKYNFSEHLINPKNSYFDKYLRKMKKIIDVYEKTGEDDFEIILTNFFKFGISFLEETSNKKINKKLFLKIFSMNQLMSILVYLMKKFYLIKIKSYKKDENSFVFYNEVKKVNFDHNGYEQLRNEFLNTDYKEIDISLYLALKIFYFIKLSSNYDLKFNQIINEFENYPNDQDENRKNNYKNIYQFFQLLIHEVEILHSVDKDTEIIEFDKYLKFFKFNKNEEVFNQIKKFNSRKVVKNDIPVKRVFTIINTSVFLEERDVYREVINESPYDKGSKPIYLMNMIPNLLKHLEAKKYIYLNHPIINFILSYEADIVLKISCCFIISINLLNGFTLFIEPDLTISGNLDTFIFNLSIIHLTLISIYFGSLFYFTFIKHKISSKKEDSISKFISDYFKNLLSFFYIKFYWIFFNGILALFGGNFRVFYSFQLISVFYLSSTMTSALDTIKQKYSQFTATILIIILISLLFASLGYNYYNNLYYNSDLEYNMCDSFFHCFLTILGWGFINGSVDFANIKSIKDPTYWDHFAFSWAYYFLISIVMVNIINAIIVDAFQDTRLETNKKKESIMNDCFICSLNRTKFEIKGIKFDDHISKEHKVSDYILYLIRLSDIEKKDLNKIDSFSKYCYENRKYNFFPIDTSISLRNKK